MKCVITGHTRGIGRSIYNYFVSKGWDVKGFSGSTGYDVRDSYDKILEEAKTADVFINNLCVGDCQIRFLKDLNGIVKRIVNCGSIAGDFDHLLNIEYSKVKKELKQLSRDYALEGKSNILHLNITMAEDAKSTDYGIPFTDIVNAIDFWIDNPRVNNIEFDLLLTPYTKEKIKIEFGVDPSSLTFLN